MLIDEGGGRGGGMRSRRWEHSNQRRLTRLERWAPAATEALERDDFRSWSVTWSIESETSLGVA